MPLTPSGKIDRRALPVPDASHLRQGDDLVAPRTPLEETLARIWAEVLRIDGIGVHDSFFRLGGDSILGIQMIARANKAGFRLNARADKGLNHPPGVDDAVPLAKPGVPRVAQAGLDHQVSERPLHQERSGPERDPVVLIRRRRLGPQRPRHDPEHGTAVETEFAVIQRYQG